MPCTHHNSAIPHTSIAVTLAPSHSLTLSIHTCNTNNSTQSQQPPLSHRVPRQPHRHTKDDHMTTDTTKGHRPSSKSEGNLIILQVNNINGIKTNSRSSNYLFTRHMQISSQFRKPSAPLKQTHPKYITSPPCVPISCTRQGVVFVGVVYPLP